MGKGRWCQAKGKAGSAGLCQEPLITLGVWSGGHGRWGGHGCQGLAYLDVRQGARCWAFLLPALMVPMAHGDNIRQTAISPEKHLVMVVVPSVDRAAPESG